jgi:cobyrinic acid a,c-diamide synthase
MKSVIIAGTQSGSGKTTITLGIMECLKRRGLKVAPFKVGPDFIDPGYHRLVTGRPSINLDGWMCGESFVQETFYRHLEGADIAVIEGVMGLFDGIGGASDAGSTAQVAKILGSPVILLVDAKSQARSAAALVKGFAEFDPRVRIAGVIFNNVGSETHGRILRESVESLDIGVKVVGCLPRDDRLHIPSRHLGLTTAEENPLSSDFIELLVEILWDRLDLGLLWAAGTPYAIDQNLPFGGNFALSSPARKKATAAPPVRIAVARDYAFCFVYEDNLRLLREAGAEIVEFSPLQDEGLPPGIGGIYLPGGYPELFADTLAANESMKGAIRRKIMGGMPVYAECGGFIYLTKGVRTDSWGRSGDSTLAGETDMDRVHEFVGVFPVTTRMLPRRKALGYREVRISEDSIIGPAGTVARGHEFHYSEMDEIPARTKRFYRVSRNDVHLGVEGFRHRNCLASYIHLHFGSSPGMAGAFVESCRNFSMKKTVKTGQKSTAK